MKLPGLMFGCALLVCNALPAIAHDCGHHRRHSSECWNCDHVRNSTTSAVWEGKITEIIYLPGTQGGGMVELRVLSGNQERLFRLAPTGFLKHHGLVLREGDAVEIKGFPVAAMEGDLTVATEIRKADKLLVLRDTFGRPAW